ncbi:hypothetical protein chiPu_0021842 [Chiloscyllium punctatum]|uniref:Uncharacterized protein n=1 Tax=Chiloscyllium punctatum TaxID=137246 RepID=A0A401RN74_CHIPU|nr:hypothetical protein [Chiloscyllium punctatum]
MTFPTLSGFRCLTRGHVSDGLYKTGREGAESEQQVGTSSQISTLDRDRDRDRDTELSGYDPHSVHQCPSGYLGNRLLVKTIVWPSQ